MPLERTFREGKRGSVDGGVGCIVRGQCTGVACR